MSNAAAHAGLQARCRSNNFACRNRLWVVMPQQVNIAYFQMYEVYKGCSSVFIRILRLYYNFFQFYIFLQFFSFSVTSFN